MAKKSTEPLTIAGQALNRGESRDIALDVSPTSLGVSIRRPVRVVRAKRAGPALFVCGAVHGDEPNGTAAAREPMPHELRLMRGTFILVPGLNGLGIPAAPLGRLVERLRQDRALRRGRGPGPRVRSRRSQVPHERFRPSPSVERPGRLRMGVNKH